MDKPVKVTRKRITDYRPAEVNPNAGSEEGVGVLEESLKAFGAGRSVLSDKDGEMIGGSHVLQGAAAVGIDEIIEVETDGRQLVVVKRTDLSLKTDVRARGLQLADNQVHQRNYVPDASVIGQMLAGMDANLVRAAGYTVEDVRDVLDTVDAEENADDEDGESDLPAGLTQWDVPDALWPTDNEWGVPLLDIHMQADAVDLPVMTYGLVARKKRMKGTWVFYTDDVRHEALWRDPTTVINSGCVNAAEPNYSCRGQMPLAVGMWAIYRKRWLARYWQSRGIRVFVDMNVHPRFYDLNMLGVPVGWKAYSTRGYTELLHQTDEEYERSCDRAGTRSILFLVYGGGKAVKEHAGKRGWIWIPEFIDVLRGRKIAHG